MTVGAGHRGRTPQEVSKYFTSLVLGTFIECGKQPTRVDLVEFEKMLTEAICHVVNEKLEAFACEMERWRDNDRALRDKLPDDSFQHGKYDYASRVLLNVANAARVTFKEPEGGAPDATDGS